MARKPSSKGPLRNWKTAHLDVATESPTWRVVLDYCRATLATAWAILENPSAPMVEIRQAQGDVRAIKRLLKLAYPDEKALIEAAPEIYPSGGIDL